jgi:hypothetical protein
MKLPKSIIKKYGITRKAWQVYRGKSKKIRRVETMARKSYRRSSSRGNKMGALITAITPIVYGAFRQNIADIIPDFANGYGDSIVLGGLAASGAFMGSGMIKQVATPIYAIEASLVGAKAKSQLMGGNGTPSGVQYL